MKKSYIKNTHVHFVFILLLAISVTNFNNNLTKIHGEPAKQESTGPYYYYKDSKNNSYAINANDFNFAAAGDFGCGDKANRTVTNIMAKNPELVIALGDLSYQKNADCWFQTISPLDKNGKVKVEFGEHDVDENLTKYRAYMNHFNMTSPYYAFNYKNVHFLAMATPKNEAIPYDNSSKQYQFVKEDLRNAHNDKAIKWIIVYTFRPLYSSNSTHPGLDILQDTYHPLFDKYGVDLVLQAHNHNYQRTFPLVYNKTIQSTPMISDKHTRDYNHDPKGPILIAGTAGQDFYNLTSKAPFVVTQFLRHGYLNVDFRNNGTYTNLTASFIENRDMKVKDYFSIVKKLE